MYNRDKYINKGKFMVHKKNQNKIKKFSPKKGIFGFSKHNLILFVSVIALIGGVYAISRSFAATRTYGNFRVYVYNAYDLTQMANGAYLTVNSVVAGTSEYRGNLCTSISPTVSGGSAYFGNCLVNTADDKTLRYLISGASLPGWTAAPAGLHGGFCNVSVGSPFIVYSGATRDVHLCMYPTPAVPTITGADRQQTQITLRWNAVTGAEGYGTFRNGTAYGTTASTSQTISNLKCGTAYTLGVDAYAHGLASAVASQSFTTAACNVSATSPNPTPAPKPATTKPKPVAKKTYKVGTNTRVVSRAPAPVVTASSSSSGPKDTEAPKAPTDLKAVETSGVVDLTWTSSTDNIGVEAYSIERSGDDSTWEMLKDEVGSLYYSDTTAQFGTDYTYRVSARDGAGNWSDYALVDIKTSGFEPNVSPDEESTISSDDGLVSVKIPAGAVDEDVLCLVLLDSELTGSLADSNSVLVGPYKLECKKKDGSFIEQFNQEAEYTVKTASSESDATLFINNGDIWEESDVAYDGEVQGYRFNSDLPSIFAVASENKKSSPVMLIVGIIAVIIAIVAFIIWLIRRRRMQAEMQSGYDLDYFDNTPTPNYPDDGSGTPPTYPTPGSQAPPSAGPPVYPNANG